MTSDFDSIAIPRQLRSDQFSSIGDRVTESFAPYSKWVSKILPNGDIAKTSALADLEVTLPMHHVEKPLGKDLIACGKHCVTRSPACSPI